MKLPSRDELVRMALSYARLFAVAVMAAYLATGKSPMSVSLSDVMMFVDAGLAALVVAVFNALNPGDKRYGRKGRRPVRVESTE